MAKQSSGPLSGLKILDLTRLLPGPVCTLHLADLGAEVIKIEGFEHGGADDYARRMGLGAALGEDSFFFSVVNRNKRGLRLDLKQPAGVEVFLRLARDADVIVESFRPGVVDKLGVGYEAVKAINPRIVYCAITGYGQNGPWRDRAGHDLKYIATAGVLDQIGSAEGPPAIPNLQIGDLLGGALTAAMGILAAVIGAKATGQGRYVDVSMTDATFAHAYTGLLSVLARGQTLPRGVDDLNGGLPGYGLYRTQDGRYMAVGALEPKFWQVFCDAIGRADLKPFGLARGDDGERTRREFEALFASQPLAHWAAKFENVDCGVTPVLTFEEAMAHPQLQARGMLPEVDGLQQFAPPLQMSGLEFVVRQAAPKVGADGTAILQAAGYAEADIEALRDLNA